MRPGIPQHPVALLHTAVALWHCCWLSPEVPSLPDLPAAPRAALCHPAPPLCGSQGMGQSLLGSSLWGAAGLEPLGQGGSCCLQQAGEGSACATCPAPSTGSCPQPRQGRQGTGTSAHMSWGGTKAPSTERSLCSWQRAGPRALLPLAEASRQWPGSGVCRASCGESQVSQPGPRPLTGTRRGTGPGNGAGASRELPLPVPSREPGALPWGKETGPEALLP